MHIVNLNKQILREHYMLPTFEEIAARVKGAKVYSTLDAYKAFWQIKLTDDSAKYTTFNTPYGRYCFQKLPYGLCSAPEVFHRCFSEIFSDIEGVAIYIDDILIWGKNEDEHNNRLKMVLERARERNIRFNKDKCKIGVDKVKYLGHVLTPEGIGADPEKVAGILKIKHPMNKGELQKFLGMITYVAKFVPNVSQLTMTLRELLKKEVIWHWTDQHTEVFNKLKKILTEAPVLQYFDEKAPITLSVDASKDGLGAVLLQNNLPVSYASKALTQLQKEYAQIEKEMLAIQFGCERFHQYIFGRTISVETDHKPLEYIFAKPLNKCPLRLQCMRIRLQPYDIIVRYKPGKTLLLADALSRTTIQEDESKVEKELNRDLEAYVSTIVHEMPLSDLKLQEFKRETEKDHELQVVMQLVKDGWPKHKKQIPNEALQYHNYEAELSVVEGLLFKNESLVVPKSLRGEMLQKIHFNHLGIIKCKARARNVIYWPQMNKEIEDVVGDCTVCRKFQRNNERQPMIQREIPRGPWQHLGSDIFCYKGKDFLLVVDMFSKYVEVEKLRDLTALTTIEALKRMIARYGIPTLIYSDNGPQFSSVVFQQFMKDYGIQHRTSSPRYPQSNGLVERYIQTVKQMWRKADFENKDPHLVMLEYNSTPITYNMKSPSDLMYNRPVKSLLPKKSWLIENDAKKADTNQSYSDHRWNLKTRQHKDKYFYDRKSRRLTEVNVGDSVFVKPEMDKRELTEAKVISKNTRPRSYNVLMKNGSILARNRRHLFPGSAKSSVNFEHHQEGDIQRHAEVVEPVKPVAREPVITRSGRVSKWPNHLKDYVT